MTIYTTQRLESAFFPKPVTGFQLPPSNQDNLVLTAFADYLYSDRFPKDDRKYFRTLAKQGNLKATITRDTETGQAIVKLSPGETWNDEYFYDGRTFLPMGYAGGNDGPYTSTAVWEFPRNQASLKVMQSWTDSDLKRQYIQETSDDNDYGHPGSVARVRAEFNPVQARKNLDADIARLKAIVDEQAKKVTAPVTLTVQAKK